MIHNDDRPLLLLVGGGGGLLGRALLRELSGAYQIRSLHRSPVAAEAAAGVEWHPTDVAEVPDWSRAFDGVKVVVNVAWYRWGSPRTFERLGAGLRRLVSAAQAARVSRFVHVSVPPAPRSLESGLPYLVEKRAVDRALAESGLSYRILRPTAMFGEGDVLLGVMLRSIWRYPFFPMFGDGAYHLSPIAASDVARAIRLEAEGRQQGTVDLGGARRFEYRELTDLMFDLLGKPRRYWHLSPGGSVRLARWLQTVGSSLLYAYEVEWLLSDLLGVPAYDGLDRPLTPVEPYLAATAERVRARR